MTKNIYYRTLFFQTASWNGTRVEDYKHKQVGDGGAEKYSPAQKIEISFLVFRKES